MLTPNNTVLIYGRLTSDAELVMDGKMLRFSVAVDNAGYDKNNTDSKAGFFNCKIWLTENDWTSVGFVRSVRQLFEAGRLGKGAPVRLMGQLNHDRWDDKDGNKRSDVNIVVDSIESYAKAGGTENAATSSPSSDAPITAAYSSTDPF